MRRLVSSKQCAPLSLLGFHHNLLLDAATRGFGTPQYIDRGCLAGGSGEQNTSIRTTNFLRCRKGKLGCCVAVTGAAVAVIQQCDSIGHVASGDSHRFIYGIEHASSMLKERPVEAG